MSHLEVSQTAKQFPILPYEVIKNSILGKTYTCSLVFVGAIRAKKLNLEHRNKDYVPNVLSFPLDDMNGEIYICPTVAKKEAHKFALSYKGYVGYLFIHGLLHLKGLDHGPKMDKLEQKFLKEFNLK